MKVISCTSEYNRSEKLRKSLEKFGWDFIILPVAWNGFGTKLVSTYRYLAEHPDIDRFIFTDAHDTVVTCTPAELDEKLLMGTYEQRSPLMTISAEVACWPDVDKQIYYPVGKTKWNFVNGGGYLTTREYFMQLFDRNRPTEESDDQRWLTDQYLNNRVDIHLDRYCEIFQTLAHTAHEDTDKLNLKNTITKTRPAFWHGNGTAYMGDIYKTLGI